MINNLIHILKRNILEEIYLVGILDYYDKEFIINKNFVYFQFGKSYIELEAIESYSKLKISITNCISYKNFVEDEIDGRIKISELVLLDPLAENRGVKEISFCNLEVREDVLITDTLFLELSNEEYIFIDPGFLGINLGGLEQKKFWEDNKMDKNKLHISNIKINSTLI